VGLAVALALLGDRHAVGGSGTAGGGRTAYGGCDRTRAGAAAALLNPNGVDERCLLPPARDDRAVETRGIFGQVIDELRSPSRR
jgi:hypothetical protein